MTTLRARLGASCQALICAVTLILSAPAMARAEETLKFDIVAQPLVSALRTFAEQANMQLLYKHDPIEHANANAVIGNFDRRTALERLLRGTGLEVVFTAEDAATIRAKGEDRSLRRTSASGFSRLAAADDAASRLALAQAAAQSADADRAGLEEVVITATRRESSVQDAPLAVTAISGDSLRRSGVVDPRDLSGLAPNLHVDQGVQAGSTHVSIRGISSSDFALGANSPVATNIDDVYQPFQYALATQVFDLSRIEVLRGPQGTLFGKNTTSGALNYYSQTPTFNQEGYVTLDAGGGDFGHYALEGVLNTPLSDEVAARISVRADRREDYIDNLFDGGKLGHYNNFGGRVQLAWKPSDATSANLKLFGVKYTGDAPVYVAQYLLDPCSRRGYPASYLCATSTGVPSPDSPGSETVNVEVPIFENYDNYGAVLKVDQQVGGSTLTSITSYQDGELEALNNDDGVAGDAFHGHRQSKSELFSQELRLATPADARLRGVFGLFGQYDEISTDVGFISSQVDSVATTLRGFDNFGGSAGNQKTTSLATFGSLTYDVTQQFSLSSGLRYSHEKKTVAVDYREINGGGGPPTFPLRNPRLDLTLSDLSYQQLTARYPVVDPVVDVFESNRAAGKWGRVTWDATANFKPTTQSLLFARVASGFRSGGFPVNVSRAGTFRRLEPETVDSYELGLKSAWLANTLRLNASIFWTDYKDMQVTKVSPSGRGSTRENAASSRVKGAELEIELAATEALRLWASAGYSDAKFRSYFTGDLTRGVNGFVDGNPLPYAPLWSALVGSEYQIPMGVHSMLLGTHWTYRSSVYFDPFEDPLASDRSELIGNAQVSYGTSGRGWRVTTYAKNLTNREIKAYQYSFGGALIAPAIYAPRRTWGVQLTADF